MATVSLRVPDELKERMDEYNAVNWSAVLRREIESELAELDARNIARAVATSERLSQELDDEDVEDENVADVIREFRETRFGGEQE